MFRFSIRELMLVTLMVAMGTAWLIDHWRSSAAVSKLKDELENWAGRSREAEATTATIEQQLKAWHFEILWTDKGPFVTKPLDRRPADIPPPP
jgi:hypothetical protein